MSAIKRPVQIEEFIVTLGDVQDPELYSIKQQLTKSISKLNKTNVKLTKLINKEELNSESDDSDDDFNEVDNHDEQLFKEIIQENEIVFNNQQERIEAINNELTHRGLPVDENGSNGTVKSKTSTTETKSHLKYAGKGINSDNSGVDANAPNSVLL